ncbi:Sterol 3-beta-glucosyltransferase [Coniosporium apollinis]|uniref:sterol 3beta-glucosyltransferase n=1 Tax=Coniosporium apollinis TaxID=61459 RepID=A0ABQ9P3K5_9PEZI|nr:Sterol 3-beta-glucosyltransferase [Coniosporium apollinis]
MDTRRMSADKAGRSLRRPGRPLRRVSVEIPDRLKGGEDEEEDVTAPKTLETQYMNQSVLSLITRVGSNMDQRSHFDENQSSGSEDEDVPAQPRTAASTVLFTGAPQRGRGQEREGNKSGPKPSHQRLFKSVPKLSLLRPIKERKTARMSMDGMSDSQILPEQQSEEDTPEQLHGVAPVMSRILQAEANMEASEGPREKRASERDVGQKIPQSKTPVSLPQKLMDIFEFEAPEEVIAEYPCWLLQSVLLQGYMYVTQKHICFYAYLPKKTHEVIKSGNLAKRGRRNPKYNRYWCVLKGDVLFYYSDPTELYFPSGTIDLRYGISAALMDSKDALGFVVETHQRTYTFRADSATSAKEWVKAIQKVIFRAHNEGDSVKISLPTESVIDIEESAVLEYGDTVKIRVIDNDETYAMDEYFFSFWNSGHDAVNVLRIMVSGNGHHVTDDEISATPPAVRTSREVNTTGSVARDRDLQGVLSPITREGVRSTLLPISPSSREPSIPRPSGETLRSSFDRSRRSLDVGRQTRLSSSEVRRSFSSGRSKSVSKDRRRGKSPLSPVLHDSSESATNSLDPETDSSAAIQSIEDTNASASQILSGSGVFNRPTILRQTTTESDLSVDRSPRNSQDTARSSDVRKPLPQPSVRPQAQQGMGKQRTGAEGLHPPGPDEYNEAQQTGLQRSGSSSAIQDWMRAGSVPLQKASGIAGFLRNRSKRMSNLLATESMGYYEKVSGMWAGGRKHYGTAEGLAADDEIQETEDDEDAEKHEQRFRDHFAMPASERLRATFFGYLHRVLPLYGKIYISDRHFCFRSFLPGTRTKLILPFKDIENVHKENGFRFGYSALVLVIRGHEELLFDFRESGSRDDCAITLLESLEVSHYAQGPNVLSETEIEDAKAAKVEHETLQEARQKAEAEVQLQTPRDLQENERPVIFDDTEASIVRFKPDTSLRITCLTIGTRGDVQPYIAFCKGLIKEGHKPRIATHVEFEPWIRKHGIDFAPVEGDPAELMRVCVENGMFTYSFIRETHGKFRGWLDGLCSSAWQACQETDVLIESPSAMVGIHIAEALQIPYFRAFAMPWTRTRTYPHAFGIPEHKRGGAFNYYTYVVFENLFWKLTAGQINRWRRKELGLRSTTLDQLQPNKVPFMYFVSPHVVPRPIDYSDWIDITGYWFLDEATGWQPSPELVSFIETARRDGKKLVYVGFGSIIVEDAAAMTRTVVDAVLKADVRCILSRGWSDRLSKAGASGDETTLPPEVFRIDQAPHDWLFTKVDAATHHGGAGTTGASLRAGIPTIIKPFFGDQFFFGSRVEDLGVGVYLRKLNTTVLARALWEATHSERMIARARVMGEQIRSEDGVGRAIQTLYRTLEYAKTLIKKRDRPSDETDENIEESWTFIGDESDPELFRRMSEFNPGRHLLSHGQVRGSGMALGSMVLKNNGRRRASATAA